MHREHHRSAAHELRVLRELTAALRLDHLRLMVRLLKQSGRLSECLTKVRQRVHALIGSEPSKSSNTSLLILRILLTLRYLN